MKKSKYHPQYIQNAENRIKEILNDTREYSDWTQICFSMKDVVHAAATIWGRSSDEQIHKLNGFIVEMVMKEINNINEFEITFKKK